VADVEVVGRDGALVALGRGVFSTRAGQTGGPPAADAA
jgi:hypothetical protein